MSTTENKALIRRLFAEAWCQGNLAVIDELLADDYVLHEPGMEVRGPEGFKRYIAAFRAAFPDFQMTSEEQIAEGDKVATRFVVRATHLGEFKGIAPTGKQVVVAGINLQRVVGGQIVENWANFDALGLLQQLGVVPANA